MSPIDLPAPESEVQSPMVDVLGWAGSDREVAAWHRRATAADGPFAPSLTREGLEVLAALDRPTVHAAEVFVERGEHGAFVRVREAVLVTNRANVPLEHLAFRLLGNGRGDPVPDSAGVIGAWVDGRPAPTTLRGPVLTIPLARPLPPGRTARVLLHVVQRVDPSEAEQRVDTDTLWPDQTGSFAEDDGALALGGLLPTLLPQRPDGGFDIAVLQANADPAEGDLALFRVAVTAPASLSLASTGTSVGRVTDGRDTTEVLVAGAARDFSVVLVPEARVLEREVGGTTLRVVAPQGVPGEELLGIAEGALRAMSARFGPPITSEIDVVEAPARAVDGLDWPGLVLVDTSHKGRPYHASAAHEWALAHGLAHQWWGHEAGNDGLMDPWIDEGLATHGAALYWEVVHGREAVLDRHELEVVEPLAKLRQRGFPDLPALLPTDGYDRLSFSVVVHGRTALFLDQLRAALGEERWTATLRDLRAAGRTDRLDAATFLAIVRRRAPEGADVDALWRRWMAEGHAYDDLLGPS